MSFTGKSFVEPLSAATGPGMWLSFDTELVHPEIIAIEKITGKIFIDSNYDIFLSPLSVFDACVLLSIGFFPVPGAAGTFTKAIRKGQARSGAVGDALPIQQKGVAYPEKAGPAEVEDITAIQGQAGLAMPAIIPDTSVDPVDMTVPVLEDHIACLIIGPYLQRQVFDDGKVTGNVGIPAESMCSADPKC